MGRSRSVTLAIYIARTSGKSGTFGHPSTGNLLNSTRFFRRT